MKIRHRLTIQIRATVVVVMAAAAAVIMEILRWFAITLEIKSLRCVRTRYHFQQAQPMPKTNCLVQASTESLRF
ncbi:hypothetical protein XhhCFBP4925_22145 [Xanthomonas hortorum pv. hederae]|nr:hypothetical protein XhhCFBP4925_22145 [Xanthomonas hortorum pv. hederae]PUE93397.1 hypothetical protein C7T87_22985 [Xanthomonas hortorum pv. hederae]